MVWILALYLFQDDASAAPAAANGSALLEMIHNSGPVAFTVLVILLLASIFSWAIMISKWSRFGRAQRQSARFIRAFRKSTRLSEIATVADQFKPSPWSPSSARFTTSTSARTADAAFPAIRSHSNAQRRPPRAKPSPRWRVA